MKNIEFYNGKTMPMSGYGTYLVTGDESPKQCAFDALDTGYRLIDTATFYENEREIGAGIKEYGIDRKELFLTTKMWTNTNTRDKVYQSVENSLKHLQTDYLDLLLIHWPLPTNIDIWKGMEDLYEQGVVKAIGMSNFKQHHLMDIMNNCNIKPMLNQVEFHPFFQQFELLEFCRKNGIVLQSWAPLMRGSVFESKELQQISKKYNRTVAQVVLRYLVQIGVPVIPKTVKKTRMKENFDVFNFEISNEDVLLIEKLNTNVRQYRDPDNHGF